MNKNPDAALGVLVLAKRESLRLSQTELARRLKWPQAKVSRVEQGKRSVTLSELLDLGRAFGCPAADLLGGLEPARPARETPAALSPGFQAAWDDEGVLLAQLSRFGVRFLGTEPRPALVALPVDETVLAALRRMQDPRVFEALPGLLVNHAREVDWTKLASAAYSLGLQNRLGMVLAVASRLSGVDAEVRKTLKDLHDRLAERKLDREEVVGPRPKTEAGVSFLRERTPDWLKFWHGLSSTELASFQGYLMR